MTTTTTHRIRGWLRLAGLPLLIAGAACAPPDDAELVPRSTMFIGVDVSGSFQRGGRYDDAMEFASRYIHAHLNGLGGLEEPRALFVGSIGGEKPGEPQAFHPIHDFEGKAPAEIEADLRRWFPPDDRYTDFNAFFKRAAGLVKRQNLSLAPVTLVMLTDGVPDLEPGRNQPADNAERYQSIDMDALEYLARNVTVRVLYPDPPVAVNWEREVPRDRVRMWTVDAVVMKGWRAQLRTVEPGPDPRAVKTASVAGMVPGAGPQGAEAEAGEAATDGAAGTAPPATEVLALDQPDLWRWIQDNVDYRVRRSML